MAGLSAVCDEELVSGVSPLLSVRVWRRVRGERLAQVAQQVRQGAVLSVLPEQDVLRELQDVPEQVRAGSVVPEPDESQAVLVAPGQDERVEWGPDASPEQPDGIQVQAVWLAVQAASVRVERALHRLAQAVSLAVRAGCGRVGRALRPLAQDVFLAVRAECVRVERALHPLA